MGAYGQEKPATLTWEGHHCLHERLLGHMCTDHRRTGEYYGNSEKDDTLWSWNDQSSGGWEGLPWGGVSADP